MSNKLGLYYHAQVQPRLPGLARPGPLRPSPTAVLVAGRLFPIDLRRHRGARRYLVRVTDDGRVRLTVPRGASVAAGVQFATEQAEWIARQWAGRAAATGWRDGTCIWFRGLLTPLSVTDTQIVFADQALARTAAPTVREAVQARMRALAEQELPTRCATLAAHTGLRPSRVAIRNQRSRWGSCSTRGAVMLNWRLLQMPSEVADYVMLHELAHLERPDHSRRFWALVSRICPGWRDAERWLRRHGRDLL